MYCNSKTAVADAVQYSNSKVCGLLRWYCNEEEVRLATHTMGKNNKNRRNRESEAAVRKHEEKRREMTTLEAAPEQDVVVVQLSMKVVRQPKPTSEVSNDDTKKDKSSEKAKPVVKQINPLWTEQRDFLQSLTVTERDFFFNEEHVSPIRRAELWMKQADLGERMVNEYSWATPDDRAIQILRHFSPIVEIGCGANAYWCRQMKAAKIDVVGYDVAPNKGGTIAANNKKMKTVIPVQIEFRVKRGGPEILAEINPERTLFLCYPDENDAINNETGETVSMAAACLEHFLGEHIVHVGELAISAANLSLDQAPWGRSSSPEFQERLLSEYHCLLRVSLQNWLHTTDSLTVWKRSVTTTIVFEAEDDDEDKSDEEVEYRHIPVDERLPVDVAAPCLQHLLLSLKNAGQHNAPSASIEESNDSGHSAHETKILHRKRHKVSDSTLLVEDENDSEYVCPW